MKYERLTEKDWHKEKFYPTADNERVIRKRLWDLENKIEQGTLVDTGAFYIDNGEKYGSGVPFVVCKDYKEVQFFDFCFTREEAEKRLKELQNG